VSKEEDAQFFDGSGSPWTGILRNASVNLQDMTAGDHVADLTADDLLDMIDKTPAGALPGAKFYMHRSILSVIRNTFIRFYWSNLPGNSGCKLNRQCKD